MMKLTRPLLQMAIALPAILVATAPVCAANSIPVKITGFAVGSETFTLQGTSGTFAPHSNATSLNVTAGEFKGTVSGLSGYSNISSNGSFLTYCLDLGNTFSWNTNYLYDAVISATTRFGAFKADELGRFYTAYSGLVNNATKSAAFQLGLWEIITESSNNPLNLSNGSFKAVSYGGNTSTDNAIIGQANSWLNNLGNVGPSLYNISVLYDANQQDFLLAAPVPEPETWAMLLAGMGLIGTMARRRRQ